MKKTISLRLLKLPVEITALLYIGDYFTDTLLLTEEEHTAFGRLLLHVWLNGRVKRWRYAATVGLSILEWRKMHEAILPLYQKVVPRIEQWTEAIRTYDGKRLPPENWYIVRTIVLARDNNTCCYCGNVGKPHVDHIVPISRGGSNAFANLATSCGPCNLSKGRKLLSEWPKTAQGSN